MFTIRLVTVIVHTILVVCTIIRAPGRRVTLVCRSFMSLEKWQQMLKRVCIPCPECWCILVGQKVHVTSDVASNG